MILVSQVIRKAHGASLQNQEKQKDIMTTSAYTATVLNVKDSQEATEQWLIFGIQIKCKTMQEVDCHAGIVEEYWRKAQMYRFEGIMPECESKHYEGKRQVLS